MAAPFVQGRLRDEPLSIEIATECGHCGHPIRLTVGSDLSLQTDEADAAPLVFEPEMDWSRFSGANLIDAY